MAKLQNNEFLPNYTVRQMHRKMVKSVLISGGHIRPGPDMAGYENLAGFRQGPGPDMISGATLVVSSLTSLGRLVSPDMATNSQLIPAGHCC